jgi:hypothetical protein
VAQDLSHVVDVLFSEITTHRPVKNLKVVPNFDFVGSVRRLPPVADCFEEREHVVPLDVVARWVPKDSICRLAIVMIQLWYVRHRRPFPLRSFVHLGPAPVECPTTTSPEPPTLLRSQ